jgi:hypothetical protein
MARSWAANAASSAGRSGWWRAAPDSARDSKQARRLSENPNTVPTSPPKPSNANRARTLAECACAEKEANGPA